MKKFKKDYFLPIFWGSFRYSFAFISDGVLTSGLGWEVQIVEADKEQKKKCF